MVPMVSFLKKNDVPGSIEGVMKVTVSSEIIVWALVELLRNVNEEPTAAVMDTGEKVLSRMVMYFVGRVPPIGLKEEFCFPQEKINVAMIHTPMKIADVFI